MRASGWRKAQWNRSSGIWKRARRAAGKRRSGKRAHNLLGTAQSAPLPTARLGWMDLQDRIAADVAAFGPPRPDRRHTQQAVAQLIRPRRSQKISFLRPALAGSVALTLAAVLLTHRAPKTTPGESSAAPAVISAAPPAPSNPLAETSLLAALKQNSYSAPRVVGSDGQQR